jgi:preprotein translocase subunit SecD
VAPPSRSGSRPGRALAGLAALILIMLIGILGNQTFSPGNWQKQFKVGLGLDLSSGTEVVLQAHTAKGAPSAGEMQQAISILLARVNGTGNSGAQVQQQGPDLINVTVPGAAEQSVIDLISSTAKLSFRQVLLEAPYTGTSTATPSASSSATPSASASGTASSSASPTGSATGSSTASPTPSPTATTSASATSTASAKASANAYSAQLASPSATASGSATAKASTTAKASSTATASGTATATASPTASASPTSTASSVLTYGDSSKVNAATLKLFNKLACKPGPNASTVDANWKKTVPGYTPGLSPWDTPNIQIVSCDASGTKYVLGPAAFEGSQLTSVNTGLEQNTEQWVVNLTLNNAATASWGKLTTSLYDTYYTAAQGGNQNDAVLDSTAIVLDGNVQEAPETAGALTSGTFQISGPQPNGFSEDQANQLANILKYGALPLTFTQQQVSSISPQLGHAQLDAGLLAGIIGLALVVLYLFYYYRGLGIVSVSSLLIAALLAYLSVVLLSRYQNFTMSLSAIAGLVVAIGITADSFIVYFERLRDEVRDGKSLRPAVEAGWKRARRTILVSDTVSFLAAVLLYHFAVSDVQGFAYTLGLTTLIDVIVVFLFTKPMVTLLAGTKFFSSGNKWSGLDPARLGAKSPWRGGVARRTVRTQRTASGRTVGSSEDSSDSSSTSKEA